MPAHSPSQYPSELTDQAAAWLAALDAGSADVAAFEAWRNADARHAVAFIEVAATWRDMDNLRLMRGEQSAPNDEAAPAKQPTPARRQVLRAAVGAAALAAMGGGFAYRAHARDKATTRIGEHRGFRAMPGLLLDLNTDSCVYWKQGAPSRLWLDRGEVAIALDAGSGLELLSSGGRLHLQPGAYNARLRGEGCEIAVLSGGMADDAGLHVGAGEVALLAAGRITLQARESDALARVTAWRKDTLVLNGESLDYALAEINRYLPNKIVIGDPALARIRLGGTFGTRDPGEFLQALHDSFGLRATTGASGGIILTRA